RGWTRPPYRPKTVVANRFMIERAAGRVAAAVREQSARFPASPVRQAEGARVRTIGSRHSPPEEGMMKKLLVVCMAVGILVAPGLPAAVFAAPAQLTIMAPAGPGGGWDQTARSMQSALQEAG